MVSVILVDGQAMSRYVTVTGLGMSCHEICFSLVQQGELKCCYVGFSIDISFNGRVEHRSDRDLLTKIFNSTSIDASYN